MTEDEIKYESQETNETAVLIETTVEEENKLLELVQKADSFKKVVDIIMEAVSIKYNARPMNDTAFINLRVTSLQQANTPAKGGTPKDSTHLVEDAEKIYKFLIGEPVVKSTLTLLK